VWIVPAISSTSTLRASSDPEMVRLIEPERDGGTFLTVMGFGTGKLKDS